MKDLPTTSIRRLGSVGDDGISPRALAWGDRVVRWAVGVVLGFVGLYAVLALRHEAWPLARRCLSFSLLGLALVASFKDLKKLPALAERRFWTLLGLAFGAWWILATVYLLYPLPEKPLAADFIGELLLALFYILAFAAFERPPHRATDGRPAGVGRTWSLPAISIFVLGLTAYYVAIPLLFDRPSYLTYLPSMFLYVVLDFALSMRTAHLARLTRQPRWRTIYVLLALAFSGMMLTDLSTALNFAGQLGWRRGTWADLVVAPQFLILIVAVRARHLAFPRFERSLREEYFDARLPALGRQTMTFAFALSILHFGGYGAGVLNESVRWSRELLVGIWLVILGVIALLQQRALDRRAQTLWLERTKNERTLQKRANDLRLAMQRRHNAAALDAAEDRFASLLEVLEDVGRQHPAEDSRLRPTEESWLPESTGGEYWREE